MWLSSESGQADWFLSLFWPLKFTWTSLVSSLKLSSLKSWMRWDTEISLCVREDKPSSEGELVHVDLHPSSGVQGSAWTQPASPGFTSPSSPLHPYNGVWSMVPTRSQSRGEIMCTWFTTHIPVSSCGRNDWTPGSMSCVLGVCPVVSGDAAESITG